MKNNRIAAGLSATLIISFLAYGCTMAPDIDSQPEQAPSIQTDALSEYTAIATSPRAIVFNVSSNTPWEIRTDSQWCLPDPAMSAASSLVEEITVNIEDNPDEVSRTATLTITAEEVDAPITVKVVQEAKGVLSVIPFADMLPQEGGSATFVVSSNKPWTATPSATWLTLTPDSGDGSGEPVEVTATAVLSEGARRTATVTIENGFETRSFDVVQDGVMLEFGALENPETDLVFGYAGETKTYSVEANVGWTVTSDNEEAVLTKADDGNSFTVQLPYSKYIYDKETVITISPEDPSLPLDPKTLTVTQGSCVAKENNDVQLDGATLTTTVSGNARVKTFDTFKYGTFIWTFSDVSLESGYFTVNNWAGACYLMIRFGNNDHQLGSGGSVSIDGQNYCFGFDNGWGGLWNNTVQFHDYPASASEMETLKLVMEPVTRTGGATPYGLSRKVYINDVLVSDEGQNVGDVWASSSTQAGFQYLFGIESGVGSMTIDSFEYIPYTAE